MNQIIQTSESQRLPVTAAATPAMTASNGALRVPGNRKHASRPDCGGTCVGRSFQRAECPSSISGLGVREPEELSRPADAADRGTSSCRRLSAVYPARTSVAERGAAWLAHLSGGQGVAGSNPAAPTMFGVPGFGRSSNGRTAGFGPVNVGSSPARPATNMPLPAARVAHARRFHRLRAPTYAAGPTSGSRLVPVSALLAGVIYVGI